MLYALLLPMLGSGRLRAMRVHEFRCGKCAHVFKILRSYEERPQQHVCPGCGSAEVKHAISVVSAKLPSSSF